MTSSISRHFLKTFHAARQEGEAPDSRRGGAPAPGRWRAQRSRAAEPAHSGGHLCEGKSSGRRSSGGFCRESGIPGEKELLEFPPGGARGAALPSPSRNRSRKTCASRSPRGRRGLEQPNADGLASGHVARGKTSCSRPTRPPEGCRGGAPASPGSRDHVPALLRSASERVEAGLSPRPWGWAEVRRALRTGRALQTNAEDLVGYAERILLSEILARVGGNERTGAALLGSVFPPSGCEPNR